MTDRDLLELIATQVGNLTSQVGDLTSQVGDLTSQVGNLTSQVSGLVNDMEEIKGKLDQKADKTDIVRLENELNPKIKILFDGHQQLQDQLNRIEEKVTTHDEIIFKRVK